MWPRRIGSLVALIAWLITTPAGPAGLFICASAMRTGHAHHHGASHPQPQHDHANGCNSHCCVLSVQPPEGAQCSFGEVSTPAAKAVAVARDFHPNPTPHSLPYANAPPQLA